MLELLQSALPGRQCLILFGSRARGDARTDSDLDVAFLAAPAPDALVRFDLAQQLAARLNEERAAILEDVCSRGSVHG